MQTATSETEIKSRYISICVHHYTLRAPCPKGQGTTRVHSHPAQRAQNRRQKHVCFCVFWSEQKICKPPCGSVKAGFSQKGRQNHLFAGIDASPLVKRETQHETYTLQNERETEKHHLWPC